jgi:hypothetical protein
MLKHRKELLLLDEVKVVVTTNAVSGFRRVVQGDSDNLTPLEIPGGDPTRHAKASGRSRPAPALAGAQLPNVNTWPKQAKCLYCDKPFEWSKRSHAKFCDNKCRARYWKEHNVGRV